MTPCLSDEELWSGIDRNAPEVAEHLAECGSCRARAESFRAGIEAVSDALTPLTPPLPAEIGAYVIRRRLGEGGMGLVYEGEQKTPRRPVAIKVVRGGNTADEYRVRLFQREVQTLGRLRHPAIAAIYEAGQTQDGQHFFAMELVRGVPLTDFVRDHHMPRAGRLKLFCRICEAINYAHQRGVVHRDLKPTNILVGPEGDPKILDFGLARMSDAEGTVSTMTDVGRLMGTLPYMSPEEARGNVDEIDTRADVYSLGVILYELLTDRLPLTVRRAALGEAVRVICEELPQKPSSFDRTLRGDLDTITLKALEKEPARRYQSAAMLADDLERHLADQPILARRSSGFYQLRKFLVRHRLIVFFMAVSLCLVGGARLWVDRMYRDVSNSAVTVFELQDLELAVIEEKLARTLHANQRLSEAEPHYRNALATFRRLRRGGRVGLARVGPTLVGLGTLLIDRNVNRDVSTESDYEEAESLLHEAIEIFQDDPATWHVEQSRAFRGLQKLYGPAVWNEPQRLMAVEAALADLRPDSPAPETTDSPVRP